MAFKKTDIEIPSYLYDRGAQGIEQSNTTCSLSTGTWYYSIVSENGNVYAEITEY